MSEQGNSDLSRRDALRIAGIASALSVGLGVAFDGSDASGAPAINGASSLKINGATSIKVNGAAALKIRLDVYKLDGANYQKIVSLPVGATAHKSPGTYSYKFVSGDQTLSEQSVDVTE